MLDMSAALDTVNHAILLKLIQPTFGIQGTVIRWFASYLSKRTVRVSINDALYDSPDLNCSLTQGWNLDLRLYSDCNHPLTIPSLPRGFQYLHSILVQNSCTRTNGAQELSNGINPIQNWSKNNRLKLNPSEFMVLCSARNRPNIKIRKLGVGKSAINSAESLRSLGVIVDQSISMHLHSNGTISTCMLFLIWIRKIRRYLNVDATKTLVQCNVMTMKDYCNNILISLPKAQLSRL